MSRIKINDLPADSQLTQDELRAVVGGALSIGTNCGISYNGAGGLTSFQSIVNPGSNCGISYNGAGALNNINILTNSAVKL